MIYLVLKLNFLASVFLYNKKNPQVTFLWLKNFRPSPFLLLLPLFSTFKTTHCFLHLPNQQGQAFDLLVSVSSIHYCTSTSDLSTSSSSRGLIDLLSGISYLEGGFTLRCLQRLSRPDLATRLCTW